MPGSGDQKRKALGQEVSDFIEARLDELLADSVAVAGIVESRKVALPKALASRLDQVIALEHKSYRDALIVQLAFGLVSADRVDLTKRPKGARGVAARLGRALSSRHISGVADAYQNIGKNTVELCRGNQPAFDGSIKWANEASQEQRELAFAYVLARVSLTARPVEPMPELDRATLTFYRVCKFLEALIQVPSGGAHQQFAVAALLEAVIEEFGMSGPGALRVETKKINASDASSRTPGDIQILRGNRVEEAFEVTANDWAEKLPTAARVLKDADLQRVHIIASTSKRFIQEATGLDQPGVDLSVIDVSAFLRTLTAVMRKPAREAGLMRLYDLLDRNQPDTARVNAYVNLLREHGLAR